MAYCGAVSLELADEPSENHCQNSTEKRYSHTDSSVLAPRRITNGQEPWPGPLNHKRLIGNCHIKLDEAGWTVRLGAEGGANWPRPWQRRSTAAGAWMEINGRWAVRTLQQQEEKSRMRRRQACGDRHDQTARVPPTTAPERALALSHGTLPAVGDSAVAADPSPRLHGRHAWLRSSIGSCGGKRTGVKPG